MAAVGSQLPDFIDAASQFKLMLKKYPLVWDLGNTIVLEPSPEKHVLFFTRLNPALSCEKSNILLTLKYTLQLNKQGHLLLKDCEEP